MIKYFVEHKETQLWWYSEVDYNTPNYIPTFGGSLNRNGYKYKDAWTNDPNDPRIAYDTPEQAQKQIWFSVMEPEDNLIVTEHLFE